MMEERHTGYYWVHLKTNYSNEWIPAEFDGKEWYIPGNEDPFKTEEWFEIGNRIERE